MSQYAIVQVGSHQFKAVPGEKVTLEKIDGDIGSQIAFSTVLAVSDGKELKTGSNLKATVTAEITSQIKGKKIVVFKKKRRQGYKRTQGHRQQYTELKIKEIQ